jgi:hypothetical protein
VKDPAKDPVRWISQGALGLWIVLVASGLGLEARAQQEAASQEPPKQRLVWRGQVDGIVDLYVRGGTVRSVVKSGGRLKDDSFEFHSDLPEKRVRVALWRVEGPGRISVIQQPRRENHFTAIVEIWDRQPGIAQYEFNLTW